MSKGEKSQTNDMNTNKLTVNVNRLADLLTDMAKRGSLLTGRNARQEDLRIQLMGVIAECLIEEASTTTDHLMKYVLFDEPEIQRYTIYCREHDSMQKYDSIMDNIASIKRIYRINAEKMPVSLDGEIEWFETKYATCVNRKDLDEERIVVICNTIGSRFLWEIDTCGVTDSFGTLVPGLYEIKRIGIIISG